MRTVFASAALVLLASAIKVNHKTFLKFNEDEEESCNPCPASNVHANPHYTFTDNSTQTTANTAYTASVATAMGLNNTFGVAAFTNNTLAQVEESCNPCPASNNAPNPHYNFTDNATQNTSNVAYTNAVAAAMRLDNNGYINYTMPNFQTEDLI